MTCSIVVEYQDEESKVFHLNIILRNTE